MKIEIENFAPHNPFIGNGYDCKEIKKVMRNIKLFLFFIHTFLESPPHFLYVTDTYTFFKCMVIFKSLFSFNKSIFRFIFT